MESPPQRQIRALYDQDTITVYQAYSPSIATPAVEHQNLSASPDFSTDRMTWIKPSWNWMMYRSGYSHKDPRQTRILALKMNHAHFIDLLGHAQLAHEGSSRRTGAQVIIQWDPERGPRLEKYEYRSIQIGVSKGLCKRWVDEWIVGIEDVTEKAREMKRVIDGDAEIGLDQLIQAGLMPVEKVFDVPEEIRRKLNMIDGDQEAT